MRLLYNHSDKYQEFLNRQLNTAPSLPQQCWYVIKLDKLDGSVTTNLKLRCQRLNRNRAHLIRKEHGERKNLN